MPKSILFVLGLGLCLSGPTLAQTIPGPAPTPGPLVVQSEVDQTTATGAHLLLTLTNPLPPSGAALSTAVPDLISFTYTIGGDPTVYQASSNLASFTIAASNNTIVPAPFKLSFPATMSLSFDPATPTGTFTLGNLMDGSTQVTLASPPLDGGQTQTWGWTVRRKK